MLRHRAAGWEAHTAPGRDRFCLCEGEIERVPPSHDATQQSCAEFTTGGKERKVWFRKKGNQQMKTQSGRRSQFIRVLGATTILTGLTLPDIACAAEGPITAEQAASAPTPDIVDKDNQGLTEIVVTATRQSESVQKVPIWSNGR